MISWAAYNSLSGNIKNTKSGDWSLSSTLAWRFMGIAELEESQNRYWLSSSFPLNHHPWTALICLHRYWGLPSGEATTLIKRTWISLVSWLLSRTTNISRYICKTWELPLHFCNCTWWGSVGSRASVRELSIYINLHPPTFCKTLWQLLRWERYSTQHAIEDTITCCYTKEPILPQRGGQKFTCARRPGRPR